MATHYVNRIAPVNLHAPRGERDMAANGGGGDGDGYFTFTVGKLDAGMAILIGERASQIEFPSLLLPPECTTGSVVRISVARNQKEEQRKKREFDDLQRNVLETFGRLGPVAPSLTLRAVTQTSITLEWEKLELATAKLLSLDIFRNNERLAAIPNPLNNTSTKLSGLEVDKPYSFHLVMRTSAGTFTSNVIKTKTHTMTDTSGISVCFGYMDGSFVDEDGTYIDGELEKGAKELLVQQLGAKWSDKIQIDTTHFVCTHPRSRATSTIGEGHPAGQMRGAMFSKAAQLSIPIVLPHWVYACAEAKKLVPISHYYMDKEPPNSAKLKQLLGRKSIGHDAGPSPKTQSEAFTPISAAQPGSSLQADETADEIPPTPISKAVDQIEPAETHIADERREPEPHPVDDKEGPTTTTVAIRPNEAAIDQDLAVEAAVPAEEHGASPAGEASGDNLTTSQSADQMDDISLGGSVNGEATEEIDLS